MTTATRQEQLQFYSPTGVGVGRELADSPMRIPARVQELAGRLSATFSETDVLLSHAGEPSRTIGATGQQELFREEVARVLYTHLDGLVTKEGKILDNDVWTNVQEIAPTLIRILLDRGNNHIQAVSRVQAANVIAFAVDVARHPELLGETVLLTAFGGSDDKQASMRLPAYPLSVLHIHQSLQTYYSERATTALTRTQRVKLYQLEVTKAAQEKGEDLSREEKRQLDAGLDIQLAQGSASLPTLTDDEINETLKKKAVPPVFPSIHLTYAYNAAAEINTRTLSAGMRRERRTAIAARAKNNRAILEEVANNYQDVRPYVRFVEDLPWDRQPLMTRMHIGYMAELLQQVESDDKGNHAVLDALKRLRGAGITHNGAEGYLEYAAAHPAIFLDAYNLPFAPTLEGVNRPPLAVITIGGEPEQDFHAVRHYLATHANTYGFLAYLRRQQNLAAPQDGHAIEQIIKEVTLWDTSHGTSPTRHAIHLSTTVGKYPVYYFRNGLDQPYGSMDLDTHIAALEESLAMENASLPQNETHALARLARVSELEHLLIDLYAVRSSTHRHQSR